MYTMDIDFSKRKRTLVLKLHIMLVKNRAFGYFWVILGELFEQIARVYQIYLKIGLASFNEAPSQPECVDNDVNT